MSEMPQMPDMTQEEIKREYEKALKAAQETMAKMTPAERADITIVNGSRRKRIAQGSGTRIQDVNKGLKQFAEMRKMMKKMKKLQGKGLSRFRLPFLP